MADKLIVTIMRGPSPTNARAVLVSDHEEVARRTIEIIREILEPGEAFDRALGEAGGGVLRVHGQLKRRARERLARKRVEFGPVIETSTSPDDHVAFARTHSTPSIRSSAARAR